MSMSLHPLIFLFTITFTTSTTSGRISIFSPTWMLSRSNGFRAISYEAGNAQITLADVTVIDVISVYRAASSRSAGLLGAIDFFGLQVRSPRARHAIFYDDANGIGGGPFVWGVLLS